MKLIVTHVVGFYGGLIIKFGVSVANFSSPIEVFTNTFRKLITIRFTNSVCHLVLSLNLKIFVE